MSTKLVPASKASPAIAVGTRKLLKCIGLSSKPETLQFHLHLRLTEFRIEIFLTYFGIFSDIVQVDISQSSR